MSALLLAPGAVEAQDEHAGHGSGSMGQMPMPPDEGGAHAGMQTSAAPLGISATREGSGTARLPDESPMYMLGWQDGVWELDPMWNVSVALVEMAMR